MSQTDASKNPGVRHFLLKLIVWVFLLQNKHSATNIFDINKKNEQFF